MSTLYYTTIPWQLSDLFLLFSDKGPRSISFLNGKHIDDVLGRLSTRYTLEPIQNQFSLLIEKLAAYLNGAKVEFDGPTDPDTGTPFQNQVWNSVKRIPYGVTRTYGEIAKELGKPGASRAVGTANGANPLPIIVPCHRVIQSDGKLGGYAGGVTIKDALLRLEHSVL